MDAATIDRMKPGAVLINTVRGALVDEAALVQALQSGRLGGALLDVYERAPLPTEHPLRLCDNVIFTPHVAFLFGGIPHRTAPPGRRSGKRAPGTAHLEEIANSLGNQVVWRWRNGRVVEGGGLENR